MSINPTINNETEILSTIGKNLYLNPETADVHFVFESCDERVPAHKNILSGGSDVFKTMFYGPLKEEGDIKIVDSTAESIKEFLRFFYFNKVDVSVERVPDVMYLGRKYNVPECLRLCASLLETNIRDKNVINFLDLAIFLEQQQLQESCESFIASNLNQILKSENFLICDRRVLERILKVDRFPCFESAVFEACMSWVRAASEEARLTRDTVQTYLGNLFYEIRFGLMTFKEFAKLLPVYGKLFSVNEYDEILQVISGQETKPTIFNVCRRWLNWDRTRSIECNRHSDWNEKAYIIQTEVVEVVSTNTWLQLTSFDISQLYDREMTTVKHLRNMSCTIIANATEILSQFSFDNFYDDYNYFPNIIKLPTPITIRPGTNYEFRLKFPTNQKYFSYVLLKSTVDMENGIVVNFHNNNKENAQTGWVELLRFNSLNSD